LDGAGKDLLDRLLPIGPRRVGRVGILDRVDEVDLVLALAGSVPELVQRHHGGAADLVEDAVELIDIHFQVGRDLLVGGGALELVLEPGDAASTLRAQLRTDLGTQSRARNSSMMEPRMREMA
jgi:hypothetical protein